MAKRIIALEFFRVSERKFSYNIEYLIIFISGQWFLNKGACPTFNSPVPITYDRIGQKLVKKIFTDSSKRKELKIDNSCSEDEEESLSSSQQLHIPSATSSLGVNRYQNIDESTLKRLTGLSKHEFESLFKYLMEKSPLKEDGISTRDQLLITLNKYKQNLKDSDIGEFKLIFCFIAI